MRSTYYPDCLCLRRRQRLDRLKAVVEGLGQRIPALDITVDPVENRGFEYHTGIGFTFFAAATRRNRCRRALCNLPNGTKAKMVKGNRQLASLCSSIPFCGLFRGRSPPRVFVPVGSDDDAVAALRNDGWVTVAAPNANDTAAEARRQGCSHIWNGKPAPISRDQGQ